MALFKCNMCDKSYSRQDALKRHMNIIHCEEEKMHTCAVCGIKSAYKTVINKHMKKMHGVDAIRTSPIVAAVNSAGPSTSSAEQSTSNADKMVTCEECDISVPEGKMAAHRRSADHREKCVTIQISEGVELVQTAFKNRIASYRVRHGDVSDINSASVENFFTVIKDKVLNLMQHIVAEHTSVKTYLELFGWYVIPTKEEGGDIRQEIKSFNSEYRIVTISTDLDELYTQFCDILKKKSEEFEEKDSGWSLICLLYLEVNIAKYNPLRASTYVPLPKEISDRKAIVNVQNSDNKCFAWAVLSALHPADYNGERVAQYRDFLHELNLDNITFPVSVKDISKFEKQNPRISLNIFGLEKVQKKYSVIGPLYHTQQKKATHINMLYLDGEGEHGHYCWIKNMSRLVTRQITKHREAIHICDGCLVFFREKSGLDAHLKRGDCQKVCTILPEPGRNFLEFKEFHLSFKMPFVIYSDFETVLKPIQNCTPNPEEKYTMNTHIHEAHSFAYFIKCSYDDSLSVLKSYRGKDCAAVYIKWLIADVRRIYKECFSKLIPMKPLTPEEKQRHTAATVCFICGERFQYTFKDGKPMLSLMKVKDHDHFTGNYRGPAHGQCNLRYRTPRFIPIFLHNMSNYDVHLFIQEAAAQTKTVTVIPNNKEKYIGFFAKIRVDDKADDDIDDDDSDDENHTDNKTKRHLTLRFLDSFRFMACSLDSLAKNLESHQFVETRRIFSNDEEFKLVTRKGVFPYEYIDSYEKLESTVELPPPDKFFSTLTETGISEEDYEHAKRVWRTFQCGNLAEYSDLYLKTDVLLLTDVFEAFRGVCMNIYDLETCNFMTLPGLSWKAMMKYTKVKLELLTDVDMLHFIRKSIRGGVSQCSHRHAVANNKYMADESTDSEFTHLVYKANEDPRFLIYLDANNLYGLSLSQYLPHSGFKWLSEEEVANFDILTRCSDFNSEVGYILEVDITYPQELHDKHDELPFCPQNMVPPNGISRQTKLIPNLFNKEKYVLHYRNVFQAVKHGVQVTKIHRILSFKQSDWLKRYIDLNTKKRQEAKNDFEKNSYKLANNAIFGKCMEAVEKRVDVRLISHWENEKQKKGAQDLIAKPNFHSLSIFNENFVAIQMNKTKCKYDKPIYVGFSVLDISKTTMYSFHYEFIKEKYGDKAKLLYSDTDSLVYDIQCEDIYSDIKANIEKFDTSNYAQDNPYNIPLVNKAVLGVFKDENAGVPMLEFVGLRSKLYDFVVGTHTVVKKAKGVKKCVVKRLQHQTYKDCLLNKKIVLCRQNVFKSIKHIIHTQAINKVALSPFDDKRYILPDGISTLAWGSHRIP